MDLVWSIASAIIVSFGGSAAILLCCSAWLGKVWANRIMQDEKAKHDIELSKFKIQLTNLNSQEIEKLKTDLEIIKNQHNRGLHEKLEMYRLVVNVIADVLGDFDKSRFLEQPLELPKMDNFNRRRIQIYGYLALMSPQSLMDANNAFFDHLLMVANESEPYEWIRIRNLGNDLLNEMRKDLKFNTDNIVYNGEL